MWVCSTPFGIAHHLANSSRVSISGCGFFIIYLTGELDKAISSLQHCFAAFAVGYPCWNTSFWAFIHKIWKASSWLFNCQCACLWSIIPFSGTSEIAFQRLTSGPIWSVKRFSAYILTKMKSDSLKRCCVISDSISVSSSLSWWYFTAAKRLFQQGHSPIPPVCQKQGAFSRLPRTSL